jgi:hypothetical protein
VHTYILSHAGVHAYVSPAVFVLSVALQARVREVELEDVRNAYQGLATEHRRLQANMMQVRVVLMWHLVLESAPSVQAGRHAARGGGGCGPARERAANMPSAHVACACETL